METSSELVSGPKAHVIGKYKVEISNKGILIQTRTAKSALSINCRVSQLYASSRDVSLLIYVIFALNFISSDFFTTATSKNLFSRMWAPLRRSERDDTPNDS